MTLEESAQKACEQMLDILEDAMNKQPVENQAGFSTYIAGHVFETAMLAAASMRFPSRSAEGIALIKKFYHHAMDIAVRDWLEEGTAKKPGEEIH